MTTESPWHAGEIALQTRIGVADRMAVFGRRVVRDFMPDQHRDFYAQLPFLVAGAVDPAGDVWATVLAGAPGFVASPDPHSLAVTGGRNADDPADTGMNDGDSIGLLGIELHSRRRNRVNGRIRRDSGLGFSVSVEHAFGNCPQYIQLRSWQPVAVAPAQGGVRCSDGIDSTAAAMIARADTFFVASFVDNENGRQVDVSHRGGKPGFVRIDADSGLTVPDFAGNLHFNTLGNFHSNPKAGLAFVDFETGDMLQLSGDVELVFDSAEIAAFQGAERLWRFRPRRVVLRPAALPIRWTYQAASPNSLMTGSWEAAAHRLAAASLATQWRPFRVTRIVDESAVIRSFYLEPADGAGLVSHKAGQHLPIRLTMTGQANPVRRTYTLSTAPSDDCYRISVRRQGLASTYLHDDVGVGDTIEARTPAGDFTIDAGERRPAVLIAAGVGVTPLLAMLRHLVYEGLRKRRVRPTTVFYAARTRADRAFDTELAGLVADAKGSVRLVRVLGDAVDAADCDVVGRIDMALLRKTLGFDDHDFYVCGPAGFTQAIYDGLRDLNVADARVHAEAFGPSALRRRTDAAFGDAPPKRLPSTGSVAVTFAESGKEARWNPDGGSLLELAEARGLAPDYSCRSGSCGTCRTRIIAGAVAYPVPPSAQVGVDEALICCAVPASGDSLILDL